jgi:hypothetical protein
MIVVFALSVMTVLLGSFYFQKFSVKRPPIGVFNLADLVVMMVMIILLPYLYIWLPSWVAAGIWVVEILAILYITFEPVMRARWTIGLLSLLLTGAEVALSSWVTGKTMSLYFMLVNDLVLMLAIAGVTNLWVQSGMKARDVAILGGFLTIYDLVATSVMTLTDDLIRQTVGYPFTPMIIWPVGSEGHWFGIGLGDLLNATVFPMAMRKAFGSRAGLAAMVLTLGAVALVMTLPLTKTFPVMVVLGPLMIVHYLYWYRRSGQERTLGQFAVYSNAGAG